MSALHRQLLIERRPVTLGSARDRSRRRACAASPVLGALAVIRAPEPLCRSRLWPGPGVPETRLARRQSERHSRQCDRKRENRRPERLLQGRHRILNVEEGSGPTTLQGEVAVRLTNYSRAMNDPWLSLITALSGKRVSTPFTWPVREIHRLCDVRAAKSGAKSQSRQSHRHQVPLFSAPPSTLAAPGALRVRAQRRSERLARPADRVRKVIE